MRTISMPLGRAWVEEGRGQRRRGGRLVHHGLEGRSVKIFEHEAVAVMIDKQSKIG